MNTVKKLKKIYDELDSVFVKECHSTDYSINGCRVCPYYSHNECDFEKTEININHLIYVSEKLEVQRKKRVAKKYKKNHLCNRRGLQNAASSFSDSIFTYWKRKKYLRDI